MKFFFFDIDGTLIPFGHEHPTDSTLEAIHELRQKGYKVFISTGRGYYLLNCLEGMEYDGIVFCNGAGVELEGKMKLERTMRPSLVHEIIDLADQTGVAVRLVGLHDFWVNPAMEPRNRQWLERIRGQKNSTAAAHSHGIDEYTGQPVFKAEVWYPEGCDAREFVFQLAGHVSMIEMNSIESNSKTGAEITAPDVSKGTAVLLVVTHYHGNVEDSYGFGDSMNDLELIRTAGHGVAMGNAVPQIKEAAEYVTTDCDKDGIYNALKHYGIL